MSRVAAFDALAPSYDTEFTAGCLGSLYRRAVWRRLDRTFLSGGRVLDLGCGTGEDAVHLAEAGMRVLAIDASPVMTDVARAKAARRGVPERVEVRELAIERLDELAGSGPFDAVLSNFGALNCVEDLGAVARSLAALTGPGARVALCLMGPLVPWEWAWHLLGGSPEKAFRRLRRGGASWHGLRVRYPTPGTVRRAFRGFRVQRTSALGALVPPPYAEAWAVRHPVLVRRLDLCERRVEAIAPLPWLADHFLMELVRA